MHKIIPLTIGSLKLTNNIISAPLAGITDSPYRRLLKHFGVGLVFTEMISANGLIRDGKGSLVLLQSDPAEHPLGIQLFGDDPAVLAEATRRVEAYGALIDINMGCPVKKVIRSGAGSALLKKPQRIGRIIAAVRAATDKPLTIKIRSGWDVQNINFLEVARIAQDEGVDAITLHPRTRTQGFSGHADWQQLAELKCAVSVPVIGSGDVMTAADALEMLHVSKCDAVMIGRGGLGRPWLIREILSRLGGNDPAPVTMAERCDIALLHLDWHRELFGEHKAVLDLRKHLSWYSRGISGAATFRAQLNSINDFNTLRRAVITFFEADLATENLNQ